MGCPLGVRAGRAARNVRRRTGPGRRSAVRAASDPERPDAPRRRRGGRHRGRSVDRRAALRPQGRRGPRARLGREALHDLDGARPARPRRDPRHHGHGEGQLDERGVWRGDLYLKGFGDPTFGASAIAQLSKEIRSAGIERVAGEVLGDESFFDGRRGVPAAGYRISRYVGPLSALVYDHGYATPAFQSSPPVFAAARLVHQLRHEGVKVEGSGAGTAPLDVTPIAGVSSAPLADVVRATNRPSDNFYAEMLLKDLGARLGRRGLHQRRDRRGPRAADELRHHAAGRSTARALAPQPHEPARGRGAPAADAHRAPRRPRSTTRSRSPARTARWRAGCAARRPRATAAARPARCRTSPRSRATARRPTGARSPSRSS